MYTVNEGPLDRALRISGGVVLLWLGLFSGILAAPGTLITGGLGVVLLTTGLLGMCPLYRVLGIRTVSS